MKDKYGQDRNDSRRRVLQYGGRGYPYEFDGREIAYGEEEHPQHAGPQEAPYVLGLKPQKPDIADNDAQEEKRCGGAAAADNDLQRGKSKTAKQPAEHPDETPEAARCKCRKHIWISHLALLLIPLRYAAPFLPAAVAGDLLPKGTLTEITGNIAQQRWKDKQEVRDNEDRVHEARRKSGHYERPGKIPQSETERVAQAAKNGDMESGQHREYIWNGKEHEGGQARPGAAGIWTRQRFLRPGMDSSSNRQKGKPRSQPEWL